VVSDRTIRAVAALEDGLRRDMYAHIRSVRRPVTRDEAASVVGISRKLAAFHLDKLVDAGLLTSGYETSARLRTVGRAPKVYRAAEAELCVSIPERRHDVLADILVDAVLTEGRDEDARGAAVRVARERGRAVGAAERAACRPGRLGAERALTLAAQVLEQEGFEPARETPSCLRLRNCPFHPLAARAPELVCGIGHAYVSGVLEGLEAGRLTTVAQPRAGECCVELRTQA
jgi:predicted ArsR family transcriptional regulator